MRSRRRKIGRKESPSCPARPPPNNLIALPSAAPSQLMSDFQWFADTLRARNSSPSTVESYRLTLATLDRFLGRPRAPAKHWRRSTRAMLQAFMSDQLGKHSAGTANTRYAGLRAFFNFAVNEEIVEKTPMRGMQAADQADGARACALDRGPARAARRLLQARRSPIVATRRSCACCSTRGCGAPNSWACTWTTCCSISTSSKSATRTRRARRHAWCRSARSRHRRCSEYLRLRRTHKYAASPVPVGLADGRSDGTSGAQQPAG